MGTLALAMERISSCALGGPARCRDRALPQQNHLRLLRRLPAAVGAVQGGVRPVLGGVGPPPGTYPHTANRCWKEGVRTHFRHQMALLDLADGLGPGVPACRRGQHHPGGGPNRFDRRYWLLKVLLRTKRACRGRRLLGWRGGQLGHFNISDDVTGTKPGIEVRIKPDCNPYRPDYGYTAVPGAAFSNGSRSIASGDGASRPVLREAFGNR